MDINNKNHHNHYRDLDENLMKKSNKKFKKDKKIKLIDNISKKIDKKKSKDP